MRPLFKINDRLIELFERMKIKLKILYYHQKKNIFKYFSSSISNSCKDTVLAMKKRRRRLRHVSVSAFVGLISTHISDLFLNILIYSFSFQVLQENTKLFKYRRVISVDMKPAKTETRRRRRRRFFIASTV